MRAISVQQPWPYAIFHEGKDIENRRFVPRIALPAEIAIQVSQKPDTEPVLPKGHEHLADLPEANRIEDRGMIIGVVTLEEVSEKLRSKWRPTRKGDEVSRYGWRISNPRLLRTPIKLAGNQTTKEVPPDIVRKIRKQLSQ